MKLQPCIARRVGGQSPSREGDPTPQTSPPCHQRFNPRPCEARHSFSAFHTWLYLFQSSRPVKVATAKYTSRRRIASMSEGLCCRPYEYGIFVFFKAVQTTLTAGIPKSSSRYSSRRSHAITPSFTDAEVMLFAPAQHEYRVYRNFQELLPFTPRR